MPLNGAINEQFGVYRNVCCGDEIVVALGVKFPDCPKHANVSTEWRLVRNENTRFVFQIVPDRKKEDPAA